jgi:hypothetical protein
MISQAEARMEYRSSEKWVIWEGPEGNGRILLNRYISKQKEGSLHLSSGSENLVKNVLLTFISFYIAKVLFFFFSFFEMGS